MNRKIFTLLMVLALALAGALLAQSTGTTTGTQAGSTSGSSTGSAVGTGNQNVDQSGEPEHAGRPDVDVDTGANAQGAVDVDVKAHGDSDTAASSTNDETPTGAYNAAGDNANLPGTASSMPLVGLAGLLALGLAFTVRAIR
jgi:hypothetical protein